VNAFGFCGATYQSRDGLHAYERAVNLMPAPDQGGNAQSKVALIGTPGLDLFGTLAASPVRGLWAGDERLFAVGDDTLYEVDNLGAETALTGTILSASTPVQISGNGDSLFVVSGNKGYIADGSTVTEVVDCVSGDFLDGYYLALEPDSNNVLLSGLFDGSTWDPLDTQRRVGGLDRLIRIKVHNGQVWLFGRKTTEVWYNSGAADYPFERIAGASMDIGLSAADSVASVGGSLLWLGSDERGVGVVWQAQGYTPKRVSNSSIEYLIEVIRASYVISDACGYAYQEDGRTFYVLTFPQAGWTVVYDLSTGMWHERLRWTGSAWAQWKGGTHHAFVFGKHLVSNIGYANGKIYNQSLAVYEDEGSDMRRLRIAPYVQQQHQWIQHHELKLIAKGTPSIVMSYSDDATATWSSAQTKAVANNTANFRRLGRSRGRLYSTTITSDAEVAILDAYLHASGGDELR
jgi:hypothetical protein